MIQFCNSLNFVSHDGYSNSFRVLKFVFHNYFQYSCCVSSVFLKVGFFRCLLVYLFIIVMVSSRKIAFHLIFYWNSDTLLTRWSDSSLYHSRWVKIRVSKLLLGKFSPLILYGNLAFQQFSGLPNLLEHLYFTVELYLTFRRWHLKFLSRI